MPERLQLDRIEREQTNTRWSARTFAAIAATALFAFVVGGGAGWFAHGAGRGTTNGADKITADAVEAYRLYVVEVRHPVEVPGSERVASANIGCRSGSAINWIFPTCNRSD